MNIVPLLLLVISTLMFISSEGLNLFIIIPTATIGFIWGKLSKKQSEDMVLKIGVLGNAIWLIFLICWYSFIFYSWHQQP